MRALVAFFVTVSCLLLWPALLGAHDSSASAGEQQELSLPCGPLAPLPQGWTCIQLFGRDSFGGAYFDRQSGVLVHFVRGFVGATNDQVAELEGYPEERASAQEFAGSIGETKYRGYVLADARDWFIKERRRWEMSICPTCGPLADEDQFPRKNTDDELRIPAAGSRKLAITFYPANRDPLNFWAFVCDDLQEARTRDLLLGRPRITERTVANRDPCCVSSTWILGLAVGTALDGVLSDHVPPAALYQDGCHGLSLVYYLSDRRDQEGVLTFGQPGTLVERSLRQARLGR